MDFKKLFDTQAELDAAIYEKHPEIKGQDNLPWKVLALQVELGELANEWRGFKKWSNDQKPRVTGPKRMLPKHSGGDGEWYTPNPLLEEYVDCLHFILTIGLELDVKPYKAYLLETNERDITRHISGLITSAGLLLVHSHDTAKQSFVPVFEDLIRLGLKLGFTLEQIEAAYYSKNQINHERQASGY